MRRYFGTLAVRLLERLHEEANREYEDLELGSLVALIARTAFNTKNLDTGNPLSVRRLGSLLAFGTFGTSRRNELERARRMAARFARRQGAPMSCDE